MMPDKKNGPGGLPGIALACAVSATPASGVNKYSILSDGDTRLLGPAA